MQADHVEVRQLVLTLFLVVLYSTEQTKLLLLGRLLRSEHARLRQDNLVDLLLKMGRWLITCAVPREASDANLASVYVFLHPHLQLLVQDFTYAVKALVRVEALENLDARLLFIILEVAHEVALNTGDELTEFACKALLTLFEYARNV